MTNIELSRSMIEALQAENVDLRKNLSLATSRQNEIRDKHVSDKFEELLSRQGIVIGALNQLVTFCIIEHLKASIAEEERAIEELERITKDYEIKLNQQRKDVGG